MGCGASTPNKVVDIQPVKRSKTYPKKTWGKNTLDSAVAAHLFKHGLNNPLFTVIEAYPEHESSVPVSQIVL